MNNPEVKDAVKYWAFLLIGLGCCIFIGKVFAQSGSIVIPLFFVALSVAGFTFYSPKAALGLLVFSMLLSPKIPGMQIGTGHYQNTVVIRFDDLLLGIIFLSWVARTAIVKHSSFLLSTPVHMPIFFYTASCVVSTMLAVMAGRIQPLRSFFFILKYLEYYLLFFMAVNIIEDKEDIKRYLRFGWITAMIITLYGYYQIPSGERVTAPFEAPLGASVSDRLAASEPNTLGGYYIVVSCVLLALFTQGGLDDSPLLPIGSFLFLLLPFIFTKSRSSYLGLSASLLCLMTMTNRKRIGLVFGLGLAGIISLCVPQVRQPLVDRIVYTFTGRTSAGERNDVMTVGSVGGSNVQLEASAAARYFAWKRILLNKFPLHPVFGWGVTGVGISDTQYPLVIGETGIIGICIFFWMLYRVWKCAGFVFRNSGDPLGRSVALGLMAALVGLLFHAFGANTFIIVRIMEPFWFLVAIVTRLYVNDRKPTQASKPAGTEAPAWA